MMIKTQIHKALKLSLFAISGLCLLSLELLAEGQERWVVCHHIDSSGLFEQCENVRIVSIAGPRARAYSEPRQRVLNMPLDQVMRVAPFSATDQIEAGEAVLIPGSLIWPASNSEFQTLCHLDATAKPNERPQVRCGEDSRPVSRAALLKVVQRMSERQAEETHSPASSKKISQKSSL